VNIILLEPDEVGKPLPRGDRREEHVRRILRKAPGEELAAGLVDGPLGRARIQSLDERGLVLDFQPLGEAPPLAPLRLLLGFPRPIQAKRIFKDLASLGVGEIHLCGTELGEKSYLESDFFREGEWRRALVEGAEQAANPRLPRVSRHWTLARALDALDEADRARAEGGADAPCRGTRFLLHPAPGAPLLGSLPLHGAAKEEDRAATAAACTASTAGRKATAAGSAASTVSPAAQPAGLATTLAIGSERGWTESELGLLASRGFLAASLGGRILKSETAASAAVVLCLAKLGLM
jgi:16S rRNA U1498 N3-methylase RsmE